MKNVFNFNIVLIILLSGFIENSHQVSTKLDFNAESKEIHVNKPPKIQGVRVTVDTTKLQHSIESKSDENDEINNSNNKNNKRKVGVRTDVTFELDEGKNSTSRGDIDETKEIGGDNDEDNGSVPVFKGKNGSSNENTETNDIPNKSPVFINTDDNEPDTRYGWTTYFPTKELWTTERSRSDGFIKQNHPNPFLNRGGSSQGFVHHSKGSPPSASSLYNRNQWRDCDCGPRFHQPQYRPFLQQNQPQPHWRVLNLNEQNLHNPIPEYNNYNNYGNRRFFTQHPLVDDKLEGAFKTY